METLSFAWSCPSFAKQPLAGAERLALLAVVLSVESFHGDASQVASPAPYLADFGEKLTSLPRVSV
jgi:hypothetical protein